ncbi:MAG: DUF427 domain-containing protein, partial [Pseudomonadota bacterium]
MEGVIRRPDAPNHYMVLKPINRRIVIRLPDGTKLAESNRAIRLMEVGKTIYDPVVYLPKPDLLADLEKQGNSTHCPLKGDASYFAYRRGEKALSSLAWSYEAPLDFARDIAGLNAFYSDKVIVEEQ